MLLVPRCSERCCHEHLCVCVCAKQLSQNALASSQGLCTSTFDCYCPAARVPALPSAGGRDGHDGLAAFPLRGRNEGGQPARPAPLPSLHLLAKTLTQPVIERTGKREAGREISKLNWAPCRQPGLHSWQGGSCPSSWALLLAVRPQVSGLGHVQPDLGQVGQPVRAQVPPAVKSRARPAGPQGPSSSAHL